MPGSSAYPERSRRDPQIGRFLGVDLLADAQGQQVNSPYAAMGNAPESMVDPNGLATSYASASLPFMIDFKSIWFGSMPTVGLYMPGGELFNAGKVTLNWGDGLSQRATEAFWNQVLFTAKLTSGNTTIFSEGAFSCNFGATSDGGKKANGDIAIFFGGADFGTGSSETVAGIAEGVAEGKSLEYSIYSSSYYVSDDENTNGAFTQIKEMKERFPEDGRVLLYGYSYGGKLVNHLAKRLEGAGISVTYMATVDAANGPWSDKVDRTIGGNVQWNDNFYQPQPSRIFSHGEANSGFGNVHNYFMKGVTHSTIDEATSSIIIRSMNAFLKR